MSEVNEQSQEVVSIGITLNTNTAEATLDSYVILGSKYHIEWKCNERVDLSTASLIVTEPRDNITLAKSDENDDIVFNQTLLRECFKRDAFGRFPDSLAFPIYVTIPDCTVCKGHIAIRYSPYAFSELGEPYNLKGDKGDKGEKGDKGDAGVYVPMDGLYAFHVSKDGEHDEDGHLWIHSQDTDSLYAKINGKPDYTKPLFRINNAGHLIYTFYDNGNLHQQLDLGYVRGTTGKSVYEEWIEHNPSGTWEDFLISIKGAKGDKGDTGAKGEDGKDGVTLEQIDTLLENYATLTDIPQSITMDDIAGLYALESDLQLLYDSIALKQDRITYDEHPQYDSLNPVTSGGLKTQFDMVEAAITDIRGRLEKILIKTSTLFSYRGSVATVADLPKNDNNVGDCYNVTEDGMNYVWTGTDWDALATIVDLSGYVTKEELNNHETSSTAHEDIRQSVISNAIPNTHINTTGVVTLTTSREQQVAVMGTNGISIVIPEEMKNDSMKTYSGEFCIYVESVGNLTLPTNTSVKIVGDTPNFSETSNIHYFAWKLISRMNHEDSWCFYLNEYTTEV